MPRSITILRLGHRPQRDMRMTTHVALTARAFGASEMILTVDDERLKKTVEKVCDQFGGSITIKIEKKWRNYVTLWKENGIVVHLTMYGEHIDDAMTKVKKTQENLLIIVGAEKVPRDVYELADFNIAVGNQPHSEVAALAVFLDRLLDGKGLRRKLKGTITIEPNPRGKTVTTNKR